MKYKPIDLSRVKPIQWGLKHEITALKQMTKLFEPKHTNLQIIQPGLLVDRTYSYLRASPDAIMTCDCHGTTVIEIKCPYSCRYLTPTVAICQKKITYVGMEKENMVLVKGHQYGYYEQIQTQLNVCKENNAKLVIWTTKGLLTIDVPFDEIYWTTIMLPAIRSFFEMHIAPEILTGRLKKSLNSQEQLGSFLGIAQELGSFLSPQVIPVEENRFIPGDRLRFIPVEENRFIPGDRPRK
ncbi:Hypothetical predicted protein [Mytilus galloprovincialis]|uniref:YqaJ viral recombinase domain-containing protein n=1 Tax=Mytilus galloprovincialis TaxID=29158 RepID=A0A8B6FZB7_MYTGA|nr:Hypothetical predicted protein [Mytilus galloprovincialis]